LAPFFDILFEIYADIFGPDCVCLFLFIIFTEIVAAHRHREAEADEQSKESESSSLDYAEIIALSSVIELRLRQEAPRRPAHQSASRDTQKTQVENSTPGRSSLINLVCYAAEADVTGGGVDWLSMPCRGTISPAVVGSA
jgi:hypothetical protein